MGFKKQDIPKPAGYDSRFTTGNVYLGGLNLVEDKPQQVYEYAPPVVSSHRDFFGSNCPLATIPDSPMWAVKQNWKG